MIREFSLFRKFIKHKEKKLEKINFEGGDEEQSTVPNQKIS